LPFERVQCSAVPCGEELSAIESQIADYDVIGIDEGQFVRISCTIDHLFDRYIACYGCRFGHQKEETKKNISFSCSNCCSLRSLSI
jgi:hypothetical protein